MKIVTIVGARPQFIKSAPVSRAIRDAGHREVLVHTGQHYDDGMSAVFFREMGIAEPDVNLGVGSGSHGVQTAAMLAGIEGVIVKEKPDCLLVFGDTNSTIAGALAAVKLHTSIAHVEAGLRSYNREMPEEHNRVLTDHCSDVLFCPTETAVKNLRKEGFTNIVNEGSFTESPESSISESHFSAGVRPLVINIGDTMYDAVLEFAALARQRSTIMDRTNLEKGGYCLTTLHRPYNVDHPAHLTDILEAFMEIGERIVFPVHPRTRARIAALDNSFVDRLEKSRVRLIDPVGYLDMLMLEQNARVVLTDSGGMQKEAYFFGVPCVTLRPETEWIETVESGWNVLAGSNKSLIVEKAAAAKPPGASRVLYGDGKAAGKIVRTLERVLSVRSA